MGSSSALFVSLALVAVATVVLAIPAPLSSEEESSEVTNFRSDCIEEGGELKCQNEQLMNSEMTEEECNAAGLIWISELKVCHDPKGNSGSNSGGNSSGSRKPKPNNKPNRNKPNKKPN